MKIAVIADGRSPITRSWIMGLVGNGHRVDLISSYPCTKPEGVGDFFILSLAFSQVGRPNGSESSLRKNRSGWIQKSRLLLLKLRSTFGPLSLYTVKDRYIEIIKTLQPDLVQALRIPFEGMLASFTPVGIPVVVNSWGNDLTLHAPSSPWMREFTRRSVRRADGFCADCQRDIRLAGEWGLRPNTPTLFAPGNGGLDLGLIRQMKEENAELMAERQQSQVVINPRGIRPAYVQNDVFFQALPAVLKAIPSTKVFCSAMRGQPDAEKYMTKFGLGSQVTLLDNEPQPDLWRRYAGCNVLVSPAIHDGTPNSLLEGMAFGCLPVAGKIESIQEWITDGENGILVDPNDMDSVANGIIRGLNDYSLQKRAVQLNWDLILERVDRVKVMQQVDRFLSKVQKLFN